MISICFNKLVTTKVATVFNRNYLNSSLRIQPSFLSFDKKSDLKLNQNLTSEKDLPLENFGMEKKMSQFF